MGEANKFVWVYVIAEGDAGPTKIGVASNIAKRISGLQCANPRRLVLFAQFLSPSKAAALETESIVLGLFRVAGKRMHGEWVDAGPVEVIGRVHYVLSQLENGTKQVPAEQPKLRRFRVVGA